jgi:hypothetical protein
MAFKVPEQHRQRKGMYGTLPSTHGNNGLFWLPRLGGIKPRPPFKAIVSDGQFIPPGMPKWEHVSVSLPHRCPTWEEMCFVKSLFWDDEDTVMQLHPPKSEWVNHAAFCLHLWRPLELEIPRPPNYMVGITNREADALFIGARS